MKTFRGGSERYLLFLWKINKQEGGCDDIVGRFHTLDSARTRYRSDVLENKILIKAHALDTKTGEIHEFDKEDLHYVDENGYSQFTSEKE